MSELAFTVNGDTFEVPNTVTGWRVRRLKPRGAPELVYARDGRPLTLPIEADLDDLHEAVTGSGKYRLDPIGDDGKGVENVPAAYIHVTKGERNAAPDHVAERASDPRVDGTIAGLGQAVIEAIRLNSEALRQNAEISMRAVDRLPQLMEAMTTMLNVASGTSLHALQQREPPRALRNAANDNGDDLDEDDEEGEDEDEQEAAPPSIGGFPLPPGFDINKIVSQVAFDVVSKLFEKFSGKMPSVGALLDPRIAYADGQRERAAHAAAQQPTVAPASGALRERPTPPRRPAPPVQPAANDVPTDPASMAHFFAVKNALTRDEQALVVSIAQELSDAERAAWFNELLPLSVPDAVATVRATLGQLVSQAGPSPALTTPPAGPATANQGPPAQAPATGQPPPPENGQRRAS
jgi:hypothetical protein